MRGGELSGYLKKKTFSFLAEPVFLVDPSPPRPTRTIPLPSFSAKANAADRHSMKIRCQITVFIVTEYCKQDQNESIGLTPFAVLFYCYQN